MVKIFQKFFSILVKTIWKLIIVNLKQKALTMGGLINPELLDYLDSPMWVLNFIASILILQVCVVIDWDLIYVSGRLTLTNKP